MSGIKSRGSHYRYNLWRPLFWPLLPDGLAHGTSQGERNIVRWLQQERWLSFELFMQSVLWICPHAAEWSTVNARLQRLCRRPTDRPTADRGSFSRRVGARYGTGIANVSNCVVWWSATFATNTPPSTVAGGPQDGVLTNLSAWFVSFRLTNVRRWQVNLYFTAFATWPGQTRGGVVYSTSVLSAKTQHRLYASDGCQLSNVWLYADARTSAYNVYFDVTAVCGTLRGYCVHDSELTITYRITARESTPVR